MPANFSLHMADVFDLSHFQIENKKTKRERIYDVSNEILTELRCKVYKIPFIILSY